MKAHVCLLSLVAAATISCSDPASDENLGRGRYVVATTQFLPEGQTSLVALVDDPSLPATLDTGRALEIGGSAAIFGVDGRNVFALGSSDAPVVTRYEVNDAGDLAERERMSLEGSGIDSGFKRPELVPFISESKAYWLDDVTAQALVWNPREMTLTGAFSLADAQRDGLELELGEAVARDGLLFVSGQQRTSDEGEAGHALALVIDTQADVLSEVLTDDRCGGTLEIAKASDGTLYFASGALAASLHALDRPVGYPAPCVLRISPGERRFDSDFAAPIPDLVEGRSAGRLVMGEGGRAYVLALHEELLGEPLGPSADLYAPWDSSAWRWWNVGLGFDEPGTLVEDVPVGSAASRVLRAGGKEFIALADFDAGTTTLLVPSDDGGLQPGLEVPGYPYGLLELR